MDKLLVRSWLQEFNRDRETVRDRKRSSRSLLITDFIANDIHRSFLQNLKSCLVDDASQETMI